MLWEANKATRLAMHLITQDPLGFLGRFGVVCREAPPVDELVGELGAWRRQHEDLGLVVVDILARIRPRPQPNVNLYQQDIEALRPLQAWAHEAGAAVLVVHHTRKRAAGAVADDLVEAVSGTMGLPGTADTVWGLKRKGDRYVLEVRGRDVESCTLELEGPTAWRVVPSGVGPWDAILAYVRENPGCTEADIKAGVPGDNNEKTNALRAMLRGGLVRREGAGKRGDPFRYYPAEGGTEDG